jgi:hypothetical protein
MRQFAGSPAPAADRPVFLEFRSRARGTLPEKIGEADLSTLNKALGFLFGQLREARAQFAQEGDNGRRGALTALSSFWRFITLFSTPLAETLHIPIVRLQDAVTMLNYNRIEPILKPIRHRGRAPSSYSYACLKGCAAATVQLLVQAGLDLAEARLAVARQLSKRGVRPERGSGTVTRTTVRNWCNEISADVGRRGAAALTYDKELPEWVSALPKHRARQFALRLLDDYVLSVFPELQKLAKPPI